MGSAHFKDSVFGCELSVVYPEPIFIKYTLGISPLSGYELFFHSLMVYFDEQSSFSYYFPVCPLPPVELALLFCILFQKSSVAGYEYFLLCGRFYSLFCFLF